MDSPLSLDSSPAYYEAIGRSVAAWALIEHLIDMVVAIVQANAKTSQKNPPQNYGRKMKVIREAISVGKPLEFARTLLEPIMKRADTLNQTRKILVHGVSFGGTDKTVKFVTLDYSGEKHAVQPQEISIAKFLFYATECVVLANFIYNSALALADVIAARSLIPQK